MNPLYEMETLRSESRQYPVQGLQTVLAVPASDVFTLPMIMLHICICVSGLLSIAGCFLAAGAASVQPELEIMLAPNFTWDGTRKLRLRIAVV
jgi:hypothetical protein